jgi:hypothetical protein
MSQTSSDHPKWQPDSISSVERRVNEIDYDFSKFTAQDFTRWIANKTGRMIFLERCEELKYPAGFWFLSDEGAHVCYSAHLNQILETITILHELMHIFLGHETKYISVQRSTLLLLEQCLVGASTRDPLLRNEEDNEAENAAILLLRRIEASQTNSMSDVLNFMDI